ncbi:high-affinity nickel-transport protein-domain-containing protein [Hyaloraphidium curvatum]|nr:high-affinity nickel-transport protein-domain-containing protein [Hyaloraphidium curvatum]
MTSADFTPRDSAAPVTSDAECEPGSAPSATASSPRSLPPPPSEPPLAEPDGASPLPAPPLAPKPRSRALNFLLHTPTGRRTLLLFSSLALANLLAWTAALILSRVLPGELLAGSVLAWTLGLRHAIDVDHIAAIDNITRRLVAMGQEPVTVGLFFALGHSTVVFAATVAFVVLVQSLKEAAGESMAAAERWLGIVGTSVSAFFLLLISVANVSTLISAWRARRRGEMNVTANPVPDLPVVPAAAGDGPEPGLADGDAKPDVESASKSDAGSVSPSGKDAAPADPALVVPGGFCSRYVIIPLTRTVDRPYKTFLLGLLFGLGFDTATQVILLSTSALQSLQLDSGPYAVLVFPVLFACGMTLVDSLDGASMLWAYRYAAFDPRRRAWYNVLITSASLLVAVAVGVMQVLNLADAIVDAPDGESAFWDGLRGLQSEVVGGVVAGIFLLAFLLAVVIYRYSDPGRKKGKPDGKQPSTDPPAV